MSSVSPEEQRSLCRHLLPPCSDTGDRLPLQLASLLQLCLTGQQSELFLPAVSLLLEARAGRSLRPLRLLRLAGTASTLGGVADCAEMWIQTALAEREHGERCGGWWTVDGMWTVDGVWIQTAR